MKIIEGRSLSIEQIADRIAATRSNPSVARFAARRIVNEVARDGERAIVRLQTHFGGSAPARMVLGRVDLELAWRRTPRTLQRALRESRRRIEAFHRHQIPRSFEIHVGSAGSCAGQKFEPIDRVGLYVPGGPRGYPSTVLMGGVPARLAGVPELVVATPPDRATGLPPEIVLAAASLAGVTEVLVAGGAQAIAGLAIGCASLRPVDRIVGPGNAYVSAAKLLVQPLVSIDGVAGPTEVVIVADRTFSSELLAAELLAQAEHDREAMAGVVVLDGRPVGRLLEAIDEQARSLARAREIRTSLRRHGWIVRGLSRRGSVELVNKMAPEHLLLAVENPRELFLRVRHAGCVFLGRWSAVSLGDYGIGTNHILPTGRAALSRGALGVADFLKPISYVEVSGAADLARLGESAVRLAQTEGFTAHAASILRRGAGLRGGLQ